MNAAGDEGGDENVKDAGEEEELDDEVCCWSCCPPRAEKSSGGDEGGGSTDREHERVEPAPQLLGDTRAVGVLIQMVHITCRACRSDYTRGGGDVEETRTRKEDQGEEEAERVGEWTGRKEKRERARTRTRTRTRRRRRRRSKNALNRGGHEAAGGSGRAGKEVVTSSFD